jgi:hypothetical protein
VHAFTPPQSRLLQAKDHYLEAAHLKDYDQIMDGEMRVRRTLQP